MSDDKITTVTKLSVLSNDNVDVILRAAAAAPSGGNVQPWRVEVCGDLLKLKLDAARATSLLDVGHYASIYALGSFLENVCIASDSLGLKYELRYPVFRGVDDTLVEVLYKSKSRESVEHPLNACIFSRCTNRHLSDGTILERGVIDGLCEVMGYGRTVTLSTVTDLHVKKELAQILGKADVIRTKHDVLAQQMFDELRFTREDAERTRDGIDVSTLEMPVAAIAFVKKLSERSMLRKLMPGKLFEGFAKDPLLKCSHVCLLSLRKEPEPEALIRAGRAMQRLWLKATALNLALQPMTVLTFLMLRNEFFDGEGFNASQRELLGTLANRLRKSFGLSQSEIPLFLFRISIAPKPSDVALRMSWRDFTRTTLS